MKHIKKFLYTLIFITFVFSAGCLKTYAKSNSDPLLSPALSVISHNLQMKKSGLIDTPVCFTHNDFKEFLNMDSLTTVTIASLPSEFEGKLYLGSVEVVADQSIRSSDINSLRFVPASPEIKSTTFRFYGNETCCETPIRCSLYLFPEVNTAPVLTQTVSSRQKLSTPKNMLLHSSVSAEDNENDSLSFEVVNLPTHGTVSFDSENLGSFTYIPAFDYVGKDKFEYIAIDEYGNRSEKASVEITVEKTSP